jgi:hypothetical protein
MYSHDLERNVMSPFGLGRSHQSMSQRYRRLIRAEFSEIRKSAA